MKLTDNNWIQQEVNNLRQQILQRCGTHVNININEPTFVILLRPETIIDTISKVLQVSKTAIYGKGKSMNIVFARYISIRFIKQYLHIHDCKELAEIFNKSRSAIVHALHATDNLIETQHTLFLHKLNKAREELRKQIIEL